MLFHVLCRHGADYLALRDRVLPDSRTVRQAHVALHISRGDRLVAAGPRVDGAGAHLFYEAPDEATLARWMHEDPYAVAGVWSHMSWNALPASVRSATRTPPCFDGSRRAVLIMSELDGVAETDAALARARQRSTLVGAGVDVGGRFAGWFGGACEDVPAAAGELGLHPQRLDTVELVWAL
jgi:uncharacterized protein YciI